MANGLRLCAWWQQGLQDMHDSLLKHPEPLASHRQVQAIPTPPGSDPSSVRYVCAWPVSWGASWSDFGSPGKYYSRYSEDGL